METIKAISKLECSIDEHTFVNIYNHIFGLDYVWHEPNKPMKIEFIESLWQKAEHFLHTLTIEPGKRLYHVTASDRTIEYSVVEEKLVIRFGDEKSYQFAYKWIAWLIVHARDNAVFVEY